MLKFVIVALVTLEILLLGALALAPANATIGESAVYIWDFASVGSNQLVCKKISMLPEDRPGLKSSEVQPVKINSTVAEDRFCANSAKPMIQSQEVS